jgi:hypothetical protein
MKKTIKSQMFDLIGGMAKGQALSRKQLRYFYALVTGRERDLSMSLSTGGRFTRCGYLREPGRDDSRRLHKIGRDKYLLTW